MAEILDDVAYLSQEIGPRPAGTEEEQQAALFIADQVHKRSHLKAEIEDISCTADSTLVDLIYFGVAFLAVVLALFVPAIGAITLIVSLICTICFLCEEKFHRPVLSKLLSRDVSQNVVVKYRPEAAARSGSRRKVVVVANYDSGKVMNDLRPNLLGVWSKLGYAADIAMIAAPIILLFKDVIFLHALGFVGGFFFLLGIVDAVLLLIPLVRTIIHRTGAYNEAANMNAAGVAVMLDVIRRAGNSRDAIESEQEEQESQDAHQVQGPQAAQAAGVVPESVELHYDTPLQQQEAVQQPAAPITPVPAPVQNAAASAPSATVPVAAAATAAAVAAATPAPAATPATPPAQPPVSAPAVHPEAAAVPAAVATPPAPAPTADTASVVDMPVRQTIPPASAAPAPAPAAPIPAAAAPAPAAPPSAPVAEEAVAPVQQPTAAVPVSPAVSAESAQQQEASVPAPAAVPAEGVVPAPAPEPESETVPDMPPADRLRAAKAAIAAMTGEPVDETIYAENISSEMPVAHDTPITVPDEEGRERQRSEMMSALGAPRPDAASQSAAPAPQAAPVESQPVAEQVAAPQEAASMPSAAPVAPVAPINQPAVPDWYRSAREKAKKTVTPKSSIHRSRYADVLDSAVKESSAFFNKANQLVDEETETRLRNMRRGISEVQAPRIPEPIVPLEEEEEVVVEEVRSAVPVQQPATPKDHPRTSESAPVASEPASAPQVIDVAPVDAATNQDSEQAEQMAERQVETQQTPAQPPVAPKPEAVATPIPQAPAIETQIPSIASAPARPVPVIPVHAPAPAAAPAAAPTAASASDAETSKQPAPAAVPEAPAVPIPPAAAAPVDTSVPQAVDAPFVDAAQPSLFSQEEKAAVTAPAVVDVPLVEEFPYDEPDDYVDDVLDEAQAPSEGSQKVIDNNPALGETVAMKPIPMPRPLSTPTLDSGRIPKPAPLRATTDAVQPRVKLPEIPSANMAPIAESAKQNAPLAQAAEQGGKTAAKSLLSGMIPRIDPKSPTGTAQPAPASSAGLTGKRANLMQNLPSLSGTITNEPSLMTDHADKVVSATGSFAAVSATGAFQPVGDELVADVPAEDRYVDDADDSIADGGVTETGAFAGPDYVDMPESRHGRFFSRFRRKNKRKQQEDVNTPQEWLNVDDDFDARQVGRERGDWNSFQQGDARAHVADRQDEYAEGYQQGFSGYEPYDANDGAVPNGTYADNGTYAETDAYADPNYTAGYADEAPYEGEAAYDDGYYAQEDGYAYPENTEGAYTEDGQQYEGDPDAYDPRAQRVRRTDDDQKWQGGAFSGRRSSAGRVTETVDDVEPEDLYTQPAEAEGAGAGAGKRLGGLFNRAKGAVGSAAGAAAGAAKKRAPHRDASQRSNTPRTERPETHRPARETGAVRMPRVSEELQEVYQFADDTLETEVWFVALGAQESGNAGIKQFIAAHREDLRGAMIVSLEGLGAGTLGYGNTEGVFKKHTPSTRLKRFLHTASQATGISLIQSDQTWRNSTAHAAMDAGLQAVSLIGLDGDKPAFYAQADDVVENIDEEQMKRNANFVWEFLKAF